MKPSTICRFAGFVAATMIAASCTMKDQEAPPLTGPSEFGTSVNVSVSPDILPGNGASQSVVSVTVLDSAGQPLSNQQLRVEIRVDGQTVDFGTLSTKSIVSNTQGRATLTYTAPSVSGAESQVEIAVTPIGTSFGNSPTRTASIRLIPTGVVLPPSGWTPAFTFSPSTPLQGASVLFSVDRSTLPTSIPVTQFTWDFGDGGSGSGADVNHTFNGPGTFFVRLTGTDIAGRSSTTTVPVTVGQSTAPTPDFSFSPTNPMPNDDVRFNASASVAAPGRTIVSYAWDFGDGGTGSGIQATRRYTQPRTYNVTLTVTDDIGRKSVITKPVAVTVPDEDDGQPQN